ncbi:hypothetical protein LTR84_009913 [Exophiala bonariae]|uniref:Letm1 RBD domain-containing protein n=1 Tax=Exophiala bonariae TaxID=1690606 RepID=A0AAV9NJJ3_9EURO|nr:hypothetical protein LTR84_009913 [Exophiala bonariae]
MRVQLLSAHNCCSRSVHNSAVWEPSVSRCLPLIPTQRRYQWTKTSPPARLTALLDKTTPNPVTLYYDPTSRQPPISLSRLPANVQRNIDRDLSSTQPAPLSTPPPLNGNDYDDGKIPLTDRAKRLFRVGKAYLQFYKTGLKNIWRNYNEMKAIRTRLGTSDFEDLIKYGTTHARLMANGGDEQEQRLRGGGSGSDSKPPLTRREYQLVLRTRHDLFKLVPFSLIFAICGEFTPLVILATGSAVVPFPCRIPQQEQQDFLRPAKIQPAVQRALDRLSEPTPSPPDNTYTLQSDLRWNWRQEFIYAHRLHLNPFLTPVSLLGMLWHRIYALPRLRRHCSHILCDTILIQREGGFAKLSPREVFMWSLNYGLHTLTEYIEDRKRRGLSIDPDSDELKNVLSPIVEAEAEYLLAVDWSRVRPEDHWRAVFRPVRSITPDDRHVTR